MTEEPAVIVTAPATPKQQQQRENKNEKKEFVPTVIQNEIDIDVSMLERKETETPIENKDE